MLHKTKNIPNNIILVSAPEETYLCYGVNFGWAKSGYECISKVYKIISKDSDNDDDNDNGPEFDPNPDPSLSLDDSPVSYA